MRLARGRSGRWLIRELSKFVTQAREDCKLNAWYPDTVRQAVREGRDARGKVIQSDVSTPDARHRQTFMPSARGDWARGVGLRLARGRSDGLRGVSVNTR